MWCISRQQQTKWPPLEKGWCASVPWGSVALPAMTPPPPNLLLRLVIWVRATARASRRPRPSWIGFVIVGGLRCDDTARLSVSVLHTHQHWFRTLQGIQDCQPWTPSSGLGLCVVWSIQAALLRNAAPHQLGPFHSARTMTWSHVATNATWLLVLGPDPPRGRTLFPQTPHMCV